MSPKTPPIPSFSRNRLPSVVLPSPASSWLSPAASGRSRASTVSSSLHRPNGSHNAQGEAYDFALRACYLDFLVARAHQGLAAAPARPRRRPSLISMSSSSSLSGTGGSKPASFKAAKLPKIFVAELSEVIARDLRSDKTTSSARRDADQQAWELLAGAFVREVEERKNLKKERGWTELLNAFTYMGAMTLPPGLSASLPACAQRFAQTALTVLAAVSDLSPDEFDRLELEIGGFVERDGRAGSGRMREPEWTPEEDEASRAVGQVWGVEDRVRRRNWAALKAQGIDERAYQADLERLRARSDNSIAENRALDDALDDLSAAFPRLASNGSSRPVSATPSLSSTASSFHSHVYGPPTPPAHSPTTPSFQHRGASSPGKTMMGLPSPPSSPPYQIAQLRRMPSSSSSPSLSPRASTTAMLPPSPTISSSPLTFVPSSPLATLDELLRSAAASGHVQDSNVASLIARCQRIWRVGPRAAARAAVEVALERWEEAGGRGLAEDVLRVALEALGATEQVEDASEEELDREMGLAGRLSDLVAALLEQITEHLSLLPSHAPALPPAPHSVLALLVPALRCGVSLHSIQETLSQAQAAVQGSSVEAYFIVDFSAERDLVKQLEVRARWLEQTVEDLSNSYRLVSASLLASPMAWSPAGEVLSKTLTLLFGELGSLDDAGQSIGQGDDVFGLYATVGRLIRTWEELYPRRESEYDIDALFRPHLDAWLERTETADAVEWVSRAVSADDWTPGAGPDKSSSSVGDLFQCIRAPALAISELPLPDSTRVVHLVALSRSAAAAIERYATVLAADNESNAAPSPSVLSSPTSAAMASKTSSWLARGRQAAADAGARLRGKDASLIPASTCVKLNDVVHALDTLPSLASVFGPLPPSSPNISPVASSFQKSCRPSIAAASHSTDTRRVSAFVFAVTIVRAEGVKLKAASFVSVHDEQGRRLVKTQTVRSQAEPKFGDTLEVEIVGSGSRSALDTTKEVEVRLMDRSLSGKHDVLGRAVLSIDPGTFSDSKAKDIWLTFPHDARVLLRVTPAGERADALFYLYRAKRALERAESDLTAKLVSRSLEVAKQVLSRSTVGQTARAVAKPRKGVARSTVLEMEVEASLLPLITHLDAQLAVFASALASPTRLSVLSTLWDGVCGRLVEVFAPRTGGAEDQLPSAESQVAFVWLKALRVFFVASEGGIERGLPSSVINASTAYRALLQLGPILDMSSISIREQATMAARNGDVVRTDTLLRVLWNRKDARSKEDFIGHQRDLLDRASRAAAL